jgi:hypothetical protein
MDDKTTISTPTAKVTVVNPPGLPFTPIAVLLPVKLRASQVLRVKDLVPEGRPNPALLNIAKNTTTALIDSLPETATGVEVKIELGGSSALQLMVIVTPHEL